MYLGYEGLRAAIEDETLDADRRLRVSPYDPGRLKSASLELHLGGTIARWRHRSHGGAVVTQVVPKALSDISEHDFEIQRGLGPGDRIAVAPGEALLFSVDCWIGVGHGLLARVEGKSTVGRAAQIIHAAGLVEPGFVGVLTLEPINLSPYTIVYEVGQAVAQLVVARLEAPTARPYGHPQMQSRYQGQHEVAPPRPVASGSPWAVAPGVGMLGRDHD